MNSRERFLATLADEPVDHPFLWESGIWTGAVARWRNEGLPPEADPYEYLGLERIASCGVNHEPEPPLAERVVSEDDDGWLIELEGGGLLRRSKRLMVPGNLSDPIEEPIRFPIRDRESWRFIRSRLDPSTPVRAQAFEAFLQRRSVPPADNGGLCGCFDAADGLATVLYPMTPTYWLVRHAGFEAAAVMLYDEPGLIEEIYEYYTDFLAVQIESILARRVPDVVFLNENSAASAHGPFMAPEMYRRVVVPGLARLTDMFRGAGVRFVFVHCGGDVAHLVPLWKDIGINGLMPLDAPTDLTAICRDHPDLALIGGIDRRILEGDRDALEAMVRHKAGLLLHHGRSIPSGDAHYPISDAVSFENMRLYVDLLRDQAGAVT